MPTCREDREELYGALKQETISLRCEVDANPPVISFHWTFNNSGDQSEVTSTLYTSQGSMSRLDYTPANDMQYGTLACWARNAVGKQRTPCLFQVVAAGWSSSSLLPLGFSVSTNSSYYLVSPRSKDLKTLQSIF